MNADPRQPIIPFEAALSNQSGCAILTLAGELDIASADTLTEAISGAIAGPDSTVVVDLTDLQFLDSTGLRVLLQGNQRASDAGRRFVVVSGSAPVERVFQLTKMDDHLEMVDSVDDAVAATSS